MPSRYILILRVFRHGGRSCSHAGHRVHEELRRSLSFEGHYRVLRKWHISLSSFIRDYLYIHPRRQSLRHGPHVFQPGTGLFLCGLWHGAKLTFVFWGIYQGVFLILERMQGKKSLYSWMPIWGQTTVTFIIVLFGWVLFRAPDLGQAVHFWAAMVGLGQSGVSSTLLSVEIFTPRHIFEMLLCAAFVWQPLQAHHWVEKLSGPQVRTMRRGAGPGALHDVLRRLITRFYISSFRHRHG